VVYVPSCDTWRQGNAANHAKHWIDCARHSLFPHFQHPSSLSPNLTWGDILFLSDPTTACELMLQELRDFEPRALTSPSPSSPSSPAPAASASSSVSSVSSSSASCVSAASVQSDAAVLLVYDDQGKLASRNDDVFLGDASPAAQVCSRGCFLISFIVLLFMIRFDDRRLFGSGLVY
jgi:hypothetical protein